MSLSLSGIAQVPCDGVEVLKLDVLIVCQGRVGPNLGKIATLRRATIPNIVLGKLTTSLKKK